GSRPAPKRMSTSTTMRPSSIGPRRMGSPSGPARALPSRSPTAYATPTSASGAPDPALGDPRGDELRGRDVEGRVPNRDIGCPHRRAEAAHLVGGAFLDRDVRAARALQIERAARGGD